MRAKGVLCLIKQPLPKVLRPSRVPEKYGWIFSLIIANQIEHTEIKLTRFMADRMKFAVYGLLVDRFKMPFIITS